MSANPHFANATAALQRVSAISPESIRERARESLARPDEEVVDRTTAACRETLSAASNVAMRCELLQQRLRATLDARSPMASDAMEIAKAIMAETAKYLEAAVREGTCLEDAHASLGEVQATINEAMKQIEAMIVRV